MDNSLLLNIFRIVVVIYSVVLHELSHGLAARSMGDRTAQDMGRLTLNPLKHLDLFGSFILPLLTIFFAGFAIGYAKPVPYNPRNLSDHRYGPAKVAAAGPLTNLALALLAGLVIRLGGAWLSPLAVELVATIVVINIGLAIFNLIPIPPLDGHWLLMTFLPARFYGLKVALYRYQWLFLILVIFYIFPLLVPLMGWIFHLFTGLSFS